MNDTLPLPLNSIPLPTFVLYLVVNKRHNWQHESMCKCKYRANFKGHPKFANNRYFNKTHWECYTRIIHSIDFFFLCFSYPSPLWSILSQYALNNIMLREHMMYPLSLLGSGWFIKLSYLPSLLHNCVASVNGYNLFTLKDGCSFPREEFCEIFRAKEKSTGKLYTCKKFLKRDGRKVRKAAKNEIIILKMWVEKVDSKLQMFNLIIFINGMQLQLTLIVNQEQWLHLSSESS